MGDLCRSSITVQICAAVITRRTPSIRKHGSSSQFLFWMLCFRQRSLTQIDPMTTFTLKLETLYAACSPELGVVSYGHCQDEALNNLSEDIREQEKTREATGYKSK